MKLSILCPPNTNFLRQGGAAPLQAPSGGQPPANTSITDCLQNGMTPMHILVSVRKGGGEGSPIFDDSRGTWATWGNSKLVEAWYLWWKWYKLRIHYEICNFTLWNGFTWAFKTLKPWASRGSAPWTPGATMESPTKTSTNWQFSAKLHVNFTPDVTL